MPMSARKRPKLLTVRTNETEMDMVQALADLEGLSVSEWVRNMIRYEHALTFGTQRGKRKVKR
jgi:hypothetical protein